MSKRVVLSVAIVVIILAGIISGVFFYLGRSKTKGPTEGTKSSSFQDQIRQVISQEQTYKDEAGFSFNYPKGIKIEEVNLENESVYSSLGLTLSGKSEKLTIDLRDTTYKTVDDWLSKDKSAPKNTKVSGETKLATFPAKQYTSSSGLLTVAIEGGVLYRIEAPNASWEEVYDKIVSTFTLTDESNPESPSGSSGGNIIYEEEEVVE